MGSIQRPALPRSTRRPGLGRQRRQLLPASGGPVQERQGAQVLIRVLWLLSCDDNKGTVWQAFEGFKGEAPTWYWTTFIPQLLQSLSHKEARFARKMLMSIAKTYPSVAVLPPAHDQGGLCGDEASVAHGGTEGGTAAGSTAASGRCGCGAANGKPAAGTEASKTPGADGRMLLVVRRRRTAPRLGLRARRRTATMLMRAPTSRPRHLHQRPAQGAAPAAAAAAPGGASAPTTAPANADAAACRCRCSHMPRQPWEYVDEILNILKTAFPLLTLTMENIAEQIQQRFKPTNEEDIYRLSPMLLLNDALQHTFSVPSLPTIGRSPRVVASQRLRFAENLPLVRSRHPSRKTLSSPSRRCGTTSPSCSAGGTDTRRASTADQQAAPRTLFALPGGVPAPEVRRGRGARSVTLSWKTTTRTLSRLRASCPCSRWSVRRGCARAGLTILSNKGTTHSFAVQLPSGRLCRREERISSCCGS